VVVVVEEVLIQSGIVGRAGRRSMPAKEFCLARGNG